MNALQNCFLAVTVLVLAGCFESTPIRPTHPNQRNLAAGEIAVHGDLLGVGGSAYMGGDIHTSGGRQGQQVIVVPAQQGYGGQQPMNVGGGYIQQRPQMGGMPSFGGIPVGECNPAGVIIVDGFLATAVPKGERTYGSKDASGSVVAGMAQCYYVNRVGAGEQSQQQEQRLYYTR